MSKITDAQNFVDTNITTNGANAITGAKVKDALTKTLEAVQEVADEIPAAQTLNDLLPSQTGNNGKVLKTDGTNASWQTDNAGTSLPSQTGNAGKVLQTDGTTASWQTPAGGTTAKAYLSSWVQPGTNPPLVVVKENTTGKTVSWTRTGVGVYTGTLDTPIATDAFFCTTAIPNTLLTTVRTCEVSYNGGAGVITLTLKNAAGAATDLGSISWALYFGFRDFS